MCKRLTIRMLVLILATLFSCESDPDIINDNTPETLFVWGYADMNTGYHKVRIRRAILEEGNMDELAQDPNLLLPKDPLEVSLIRWNYTTAEETILMHPEVYPKDPGTFSTEQNIIYEGYLPIPAGQTVSLFIKNLNTGEITSSPKVACQAPGFKFPVWYGWYEPQFLFTNTEEPFTVLIHTNPYLVQKLLIELKYVDVMNNGDVICQKSLFSGQNVYPINGIDLYQRGLPLDYLFNIFNRVIPDVNDLNYRQFYRFNFKSVAASSALRGYLKNANRYQDNRKLSFNNITNGYGIFYATHWVQTGNIEPSHSFPEALFSDTTVQNLKFSRYIYEGVYIDPDSSNLKIW